MRVLGDPVAYGISGLITLGNSGWPKVSARVAADMVDSQAHSLGDPWTSVMVIMSRGACFDRSGGLAADRS